jgi:hypothetical protein
MRHPPGQLSELIIAAVAIATALALHLALFVFMGSH